MVLLFIAASLIAVATYFGLEAMTVKQKQLAVSLKRAKRYGGFSLREVELGKSVSTRVIAPSVERLARLAAHLPTAASVDELRKRLIAAGLGQTISPQTFLALKAGLSATCLGVAFIMIVLGSSVTVTLLFGVAAAAGFFIAPDFVLTMRQRARKQEIQVQLPDILDLLCVSVEAGLGFDAALGKVVEKMEGPLVEEISLVTQEMRIGESRPQALRNFADRVDLQETTSFARSIIQADQLGISLGRILRVQAQDMRNRRQMAAEEKAMKAPIKMLFPTVLFIFPAMFIVTVGPAMIALLKVFSGGH